MALLRMVPARERLGSYDAAVRQGDLRMIVEFKFSLGKSAPQTRFASPS